MMAMAMQELVGELSGLLEEPHHEPCEGHVPGQQAEQRYVHAVELALGLLAQGAVMKPAVQAACAGLVGRLFRAHASPLAAQLGREGQLESAEAALLAFMGAACSSAHTAASSSGGDGPQAELHAAWAACQRQLFEAALLPHPLLAQLLVGVWGGVVRWVLVSIPLCCARCPAGWNGMGWDGTCEHASMQSG